MNGTGGHKNRVLTDAAISRLRQAGIRKIRLLDLIEQEKVLPDDLCEYIADHPGQIGFSIAGREEKKRDYAGSTGWEIPEASSRTH